MIHKTGGVVLHRFKYSDSKVIAKIFTEEFGLQSYIFFGANTKKGRMQVNLLQPFMPLELLVYYKETVEMQKAKDAALMFPVNSLGMDFSKNAISLFLSEFIYKVLKENEPDKKLYNFLIKSISILDTFQFNPNNFHLKFLLELSMYLGINPGINYSEANKIFDLQAAKFIVGQPNHNDYLNEQRSKILFSLLETSLEDCNHLTINNVDRKIILDIITKFYNIHLDRPGKLKSQKVLADVFS